MPEEQQNVVPQNKKKFYLIGLAISFGVCSFLFGLILIIEFFGLNMNMKDDGYLIMIDASTISDLISYSIKLVWYTTFHKSLRNVKLARTYADYRLEKRSKGKTNTSFIALGGAPYLIAGLILLIPYYAFR